MRHPVAARAAALVTALAAGVAGCASSDPSVTTITSSEREELQVQVVVDSEAASGTGATEVQFAVVRFGGAEPVIAHTHSFESTRDTYVVDVTDAVAVDVVVGGAVVAPLNRAFWEAHVSGPILVRIQRAGVMVRRKIVGPGGCSGEDREVGRCDTVANKAHLPFDLPLTAPMVLPVKVLVDRVFVDDVGSGPLVIQAVRDDDAVGDVLVQQELEGSRPWQGDLVVDTSATLRLSMGGGRVVDVPPQVWTRSWGALSVTYEADVAVIRRRVADGQRLHSESVRIAFDPADGGAVGS